MKAAPFWRQEINRVFFFFLRIGKAGTMYSSKSCAPWAASNWPYRRPHTLLLNSPGNEPIDANTPHDPNSLQKLSSQWWAFWGAFWTERNYHAQCLNLSSQNVMFIFPSDWKKKFAGIVGAYSSVKSAWYWQLQFYRHPVDLWLYFLGSLCVVVKGYAENN